MRAYRRVTGLLLAALLCGCQQLPQQRAGQASAVDEPAWKSVRLADGSDTLELRSGQVVVTDSAGTLALFFSLFAQDYSPFVHTGILVLESGEPFVYETYGEIRPRLGGRPTDLIQGRVRRSPFPEFVKRGKYVEIYEPPKGVDVDRVIGYVQDQFARQTPFDPYFRYDEHDALYCTELTALALDAGGWQSPPLLPFPDNPSLARVRHWLGITDRGTMHAQQLISPERCVAALSVRRTQEHFHVDSELKRELHRRLTPAHKLGPRLAWNGTSLDLRPPITEVHVRGMQRDRGRDVPPLAQVREDIRALALELCGTMES